ncbi:MAG TPA: ABC transporter permease [Bryobacteraceae bacterium]|nr:ABC transporter permease [Bryobacteraceae bacterium]
MWFRKRGPEAQLNAELRYHFERLIRESIESGMEPEEARRRAQLEFGGIEQIKEECRDVHGRWLDDFGKDLHYAVRTLRRSPGFLVVSVLSLALGIGANTAIFSLINAVMLRPLPVKEPGRLVQISRIMPNGQPGVVSYPLFQYLRVNLQSISAASAEWAAEPAILMDGAEEVISAELVSGDQYSVLGIEATAGRLLEPADDVVSPGSPAAVISYGYWQRRFGLDPAAIGKTFSIRNNVFTIVGVTPQRYHGTRLGRYPDITLPLTMMLSDGQRRESTFNMLSMMGRLKPGGTIGQANAELQAPWRSFLEVEAVKVSEKDRPGILSQRAAVLSAYDGFNSLRRSYSKPLLVLMGIVALVLLLACANLSGLLLARAESRQREISIRLAMGARAGRLMRQFLAESLVLAILGGSAGLLLAFWLSSALVGMLANGSTLLLSTAPDWRVLAFTGAISLLVCLLAGVAPGWHAVQANINPSLKEVRSGGRRHLGKALVVAQLSISMVLVVAATLFVGTLVKLYSVDRGLRTDGVLTFSVRSRERYPQTRCWAVQSAIVDRMAALPGVASASAVQVVPISGGLWTRAIEVEGYTFRSDESEAVGFNVIAPKYFATLGTPLLSGREFDSRDTNTARKVAIVNESFARHFFGAQSPLGRRVTSLKVAYEVVGVVKDAKYQSLRSGVLKTMYIPWTQREGEQPSSYSFLARVAAGNPMRLAAGLEKLVRDADPGLRLRGTQTYSTLVDQSIVTERVMATLGGFFGLLALLVACLGMFGVLAFQVSRRINEIGLRMALGASRSGIVVLILREVAAMLALGSGIGAAAALALTGLAGKMLFGVTPTQPTVFILSALVLAVAALAAGWLPARRASRVDPIVALRHE